MTGTAARVALGSRSSLTASLLRTLLSGAGAHVVCETYRLADLGPLVGAERPDVVILELEVVTALVVQLISEIAEIGPPLLILCRDPAPGSVIEAMAAGASGFLSLEIGSAELIAAVGAVHRRETPLDPRAAAVLVEQWRTLRRGTPGPRDSSGRLSARERDVLVGMARGDTTKVVARQLGMAVKTVENHKTRIFAKLGVRTQAEAVAVAIGSGLVADR